MRVALTNLRIRGFFYEMAHVGRSLRLLESVESCSWSWVRWRALLTTQKEREFECENDVPLANRYRPDTVTNNPVYSPRSHGFYVAVISPWSEPCGRQLNGGADAPGKAEAAKCRTHEPLWKADDRDFAMMAFGVYGQCGEGLQQVIDSVQDIT